MRKLVSKPTDVRGTPKLQYSNSAILWLMRHFAISVTPCNHLPKKSHWVANTYWSPSTCRILSTLTMPFPFLFLCLAIAILFHLHLVSHIISNTFYISYSPLISLPWSAAGCYAPCSLCSPPLLGESLEFSLWIPLARYASLSCVVFI